MNQKAEKQIAFRRAIAMAMPCARDGQVEDQRAENEALFAPFGTARL